MADFENFAELIGKYNSTLPTLSNGQASNAQLTSDGKLLVSIPDSVAVTGTFWQATQPVSGTFWQATQPVSIAATVTVDGSGVTQPVSGTFWQATQPVSVASLPLPSGASTLAEQQSQTTALQLIDNLVLLDGAIWSAGSSGVEMLAVRKDAAGALTGVADGDMSPLQVNANGELKVAGSLTITNLPGAGTDQDKGSDETGDGLVALTAGPDVLVSIAVPTGTLKISGWSWSSDKQCTFRLEVYDLAVLVKIIRVMLNSGSVPSDSMDFPLPIEIAGATNRVVRVAATKVGGGAGGSAAAGINAELV